MATLTIYCGREKPFHAAGVNQCRMLAFAHKYPGWHTYASDRATLAALRGLVRRDCIVVNYETCQFQLA